VNENENTTFQNLWVPATAVLRDKPTALNVPIKKWKKSQINHQLPP
jgi:hypothetical protein